MCLDSLNITYDLSWTFYETSLTPLVHIVFEGPLGSPILLLSVIFYLFIKDCPPDRINQHLLFKKFTESKCQILRTFFLQNSIAILSLFLVHLFLVIFIKKMCNEITPKYVTKRRKTLNIVNRGIFS